jgi:formamidopyrimidine-DNA glycosylase
MIEIPEAMVLSREIDEILSGKTIRTVTAAHSPHKFAWYFEDPGNYHALLAGKSIESTCNQGGMVEMMAGDAVVLLSEGIRIRYLSAGEDLPAKHQLLIEFDDHSFFVCSVQMYGGLVAFPRGAYDNEYYSAAREKPSPLSAAFDRTYFQQLLAGSSDKLSLKGFLATEQRIPGLGNGVLQDILFHARLHPAKKINTLSEAHLKKLFDAVKGTLAEMADQGGRDTEQDLFGVPGGYKTLLCKYTVNTPCPVCGTIIKKKAYMGGSIYYCEQCQES